MEETMAKHERKIEHKGYEFEAQEFKESDGLGGLTGYLSTFGNLDAGDDIVEAGAFTKTLQERPVNPLIWHHDPSEPSKVVGSFTAKEDAKGLFIDADFLPDPDSQNVRIKVRALKEKGVKIGLSIGYQVLRSAWDKVKGEPVRLLQELKLNEGSLTLFPMNELALVTGVKTDDGAQALAAEPDNSTPAAEPQDDKSTPEANRLHLLEGLIFKI
jgi:hypothetical protein